MLEPAEGALLAFCREDTTDMKCVMLVGGEGTRLRPLTYSIPKQMLPIVEMTMIERVVDHLSRSGVDEAVLSLGYKPDVFIEAFPDGQLRGVKLKYAVEPEPLDTAGAIKFAAEYAGIDETFLVVNGDVLTDAPPSLLVAFHKSHSAEATVALTPVEDPSAFGVVVTGEDGRVSDFIEKPPAGTAPTNLINAGTYVLEPSVLNRISSGRKVSIEREVFPGLAADGSLYASSSDLYWLDAGTPAQYLQAHQDLLSGIRGPSPHSQAVRIGNDTDIVWSLGDSEIEGSVTGPTMLGAGCRVLVGARVVASTVGSGCVVGSNAIVENSVILPGAVISDGSRVVDSIIGYGAIVGDKALVENLSIVGNGQVIEPGVSLNGDKVPN